MAGPAATPLLLHVDMTIVQMIKQADVSFPIVVGLNMPATDDTRVIYFMMREGITFLAISIVTDSSLSIGSVYS